MIMFAALADLHQKFWESQNNILKIYIFNIIVTNVGRGSLSSINEEQF